MFPRVVLERSAVRAGRDPAGMVLRRTAEHASSEQHFLPWAVATQGKPKPHRVCTHAGVHACVCVCLLGGCEDSRVNLNKEAKKHSYTNELKRSSEIPRDGRQTN